MAKVASQTIVRSVSSFIAKIKDLSRSAGEFYTFRGEANADWALKPGIMRPGREKLLDSERGAIRDLISVHPNEFLTDESMFDRLVRMQHFGLPTRLLDVTNNPLVALYNASDNFRDQNKRYTAGRVMCFNVPNARKKYYDSDTVSCVANLANLSSDEKSELLKNKHAAIADFNDPLKSKVSDRLLQFIKAEKPSFRPIINGRDLDMLWYVVPKLNNRRIIAQNGAFFNLWAYLESQEAGDF